MRKLLSSDNTPSSGRKRSFDTQRRGAPNTSRSLPSTSLLGSTNSAMMFMHAPFGEYIMLAICSAKSLGKYCDTSSGNSVGKYTSNQLPFFHSFQRLQPFSK